MRPLNNLLSNPLLNLLHINCVDQPRHDMPALRYEISGFNTAYNHSNKGTYPAIFSVLPIFFHHGPVYRDAPMNGASVESLLLVIADHLRTKLGTSMACMEDQVSLEAIQVAIDAQSNRSEMAHSSMEAFEQLAI